MRSELHCFGWTKFHKLCEVLGVSHFASDERFSTNPSRVVHRDVLLTSLADRIRSSEVAPTREQLLSQLRALSVPAGAVNDMEAVFAQPQALDLVVSSTTNTIQSQDDAVVQQRALGIRQIAFRRAGGPEQHTELSRPPRYAEHTEAILFETLGLTLDQVKALRAEGAIV
jgi:formyl-CoA transferase